MNKMKRFFMFLALLAVCALSVFAEGQEEAIQSKVKTIIEHFAETADAKIVKGSERMDIDITPILLNGGKNGETESALTSALDRAIRDYAWEAPMRIKGPRGSITGRYEFTGNGKKVTVTLELRDEDGTILDRESFERSTERLIQGGLSPYP